MHTTSQIVLLLFVVTNLVYAQPNTSTASRADNRTCQISPELPPVFDLPKWREELIRDFAVTERQLFYDDKEKAIVILVPPGSAELGERTSAWALRFAVRFDLCSDVAVDIRMSADQRSAERELLYKYSLSNNATSSVPLDVVKLMAGPDIDAAVDSSEGWRGGPMGRDTRNSCRLDASMNRSYVFMRGSEFSTIAPGSSSQAMIVMRARAWPAPMCVGFASFGHRDPESGILPDTVQTDPLYKQIFESGLLMNSSVTFGPSLPFTYTIVERASAWLDEMDALTEWHRERFSSNFVRQLREILGGIVDSATQSRTAKATCATNADLSRLRRSARTPTDKSAVSAFGITFLCEE